MTPPGWGRTEHNMTKPVAYLYASIAGPVVLHRLKQMGLAKPSFSEKVVDDDLESANKWPNAHSMTPLYTKPQWQGLTKLHAKLIAENSPNVEWAVMMTEQALKEKNT